MSDPTLTGTDTVADTPDGGAVAAGAPERGPHMAGFDTGAFTCPRCGSTVAEEFYGPCTRCIRDLRAAYAGEAREVEAVAYEPKMNVTPNAVALKD